MDDAAPSGARVPSDSITVLLAAETDDVGSGGAGAAQPGMTSAADAEATAAALEEEMEAIDAVCMMPTPSQFHPPHIPPGDRLESLLSPC